MQNTSTSIRWLLMLIALLACSVAQADESEDVAEAGAMFTAAEKAYQQGEYQAAAEGFEASHSLVPHGSALYNAAMAWLAAEDRPRAADAFAGARKTGGMDSGQDSSCLEKLAELRAELGRVAIGGPQGTIVWLEHAAELSAPALVHVEPGRYRVRAQLPSGKTLTEMVRVAAGGLVTISFVPPARATRPEAPEAPTEPDAPAAGDSVLPVIGWVAVGTAVAVTGVAIGLGVASLDARDEFDASGYYDHDAYHRADDLRTATNVSWAIAGMSAAAGVLMLVISYTATEDTDPTAASAELQVGPGGMRLTGRW